MFEPGKKGENVSFSGTGRRGDNFFLFLFRFMKISRGPKNVLKNYIFGPKKSNFLPKCHFSIQTPLPAPSPNSWMVSWPVYLNPEKIMFFFTFPYLLCAPAFEWLYLFIFEKIFFPLPYFYSWPSSFYFRTVWPLTSWAGPWFLFQSIFRYNLFKQLLLGF